MKEKTKIAIFKRMLACALMLVMVLGLMPGMALEVKAATEEVTYVDASGVEQSPVNCTIMTSNTNYYEISGGWYVVKGNVTLSNENVLAGDVNLILTDGCQLNVNQYFYGSNKKLTVWGQSGGTGTLTAGMNNSGAIWATNFIINGGNVITTNQSSEAIKSGSSVSVNGGTLTVKGGNQAFASNTGNIEIASGLSVMAGSNYDGTDAAEMQMDGSWKNTLVKSDIKYVKISKAAPVDDNGPDDGNNVGDKAPNNFKHDQKKEQANFAGGKLNNNADELFSRALESLEKKEVILEGIPTSVWLEVNSKEANALSVSDAEKLRKVAPAGYIVPNNGFIDINLWKKIGDREKERIINVPGGKVSITINVPTDLQRGGRVYKVIRLHDGKAEALDTKQDSNYNLTFETDGFSTYAISYSDNAAPAAVKAPKTGDNSYIYSLILLLIASIGVLMSVRNKDA